MRPPAIEKMGYYPTDLPVVESISSALQMPTTENIRVLDPCAGEGTAVNHLAQLLGINRCETWGAELSYIRAEQAAKKMTRLYDTAWQRCALTDESISLLFLNPPYDDDRLGTNKRLEYGFLKSCTPKLMPEGILIFIVPIYSLQKQDTSKYLLSHYTDLSIFRFPQQFYERFKQVVLFGKRRMTPTLPDSNTLQTFSYQVESSSVFHPNSTKTWQIWKPNSL